MKATLNTDNYQWIMLKSKPTMDDDGRLVLFVPKKSTVPLKHFAMMSNLSVEKVDDKGVWLVLR